MKADPTTMTVKDLLDLKRKEMLKANPEYQRGAVWTPAQQKKLIDSVLRGYPIPLIYLHHIKDTAAGITTQRFEVIDGQQRINALWEFHEGHHATPRKVFTLFHPAKDEAEARFPEFIKKQPCPWGGLQFRELPENLRHDFLHRPLPIVQITTDDHNEARDLFVRLQAGMPLNAQEKRDAWPGQFTDYVLGLGGKPGIVKYAGHEFFDVLMKAKMTKDRGKYRQLAAQIAMLFFTRRQSDGERFCDINSRAIDDFYYENLGFDACSPDAQRLPKVLDRLTQLFGDQKRKKIQGHEAIHLVLLVDALMDDYTSSWEAGLAKAFDKFREKLVNAVKTRHDPQPHEFWLRYGLHTRTNSDRAVTIRHRHEFFISQMAKWMKLIPKDSKRLFGPVEREIIYYRDRKLCAVCLLNDVDAPVSWADAQIHHIDGHAGGGRSEVDNGVLVHANCHPKGKAAEEKFAKEWRKRKSKVQ